LLVLKDFQNYFAFPIYIGGVMVSVHTSSVVDREFDLHSGQTRILKLYLLLLH
jgi:hypothetical protein